MEAIIPDSDSFYRTMEALEGGNPDQAYAMLMDILDQDLRSLDAHAHLGNLFFEEATDLALRHYNVGMRIGQHALTGEFTGVLPLGFLDNRPYLRCVRGCAISLWRMGENHKAAASLFELMLWLNPNDNQGTRYCLENVRAGKEWVAK